MPYINGFTRNEAEKQIRKTAKLAGLTFKKQNSRINSEQSFKFIDRATGETVASNYLFWSAYEDCMSGFIETYDKKTKEFNGL